LSSSTLLIAGDAQLCPARCCSQMHVGRLSACWCEIKCGALRTCRMQHTRSCLACATAVCVHQQLRFDQVTRSTCALGCVICFKSTSQRCRTAWCGADSREGQQRPEWCHTQVLSGRTWMHEDMHSCRQETYVVHQMQAVINWYVWCITLLRRYAAWPRVLDSAIKSIPRVPDDVIPIE
jgi:hypothetical protein